MGHIIETNIEGLGIEERRESYYIYELDSKKEHIFQFKENGIVEISKDFLKKILKFFNEKSKGDVFVEHIQNHLDKGESGLKLYKLPIKWDNNLTEEELKW